MQTHSQLRLRIALGQYFPGSEGVSLSYRVAATTLRIGKKRKPECIALFYDEFYLPVLLDTFKTGWQYNELCQPLDSLLCVDKTMHLTNTLRTWFDQGMNMRKTAQALQIHRNSLDYRMRRIRDICQVDFDSTADRFRLFLALELSGDLI